jgi:hydrophobic/amphiphilic exporter-1 (mainly G- bacteria), HAE1 family
MLILVLVVMGAVSYRSIGVDLYPKTDIPVVSITTTLRGASPEIMDIDVTDKIEEAISTIAGVKSISSTSTEGVSIVAVEFVLERNIDIAAQDVREKIGIIRAKLPADIDEPTIEKVDIDAAPVINIALWGQKSTRELSTYADEILKEQLQRINGVGAVRLSGTRLRQARVWLDSDKLRAYAITAQDVTGSLRRENIELPSGRIESDTKEYTVKVKGEFPNIADFNDMVIGYYKQAPIRLRDIGYAEDGMEEKRSISRYNGINSVNVAIQKQSGTNTVEVIDKIKKELEVIGPTLPSGMHLSVAFDQSEFIKRSINDVQHHLVYGGIFAIFAVLLFLRNVRTTIISALAIPSSIIATLAIMNAFGFTFNNMTMLALSLSIGILIDDAIIVIENISRHIEDGMSPKEAASFATSEIGTAVMATTLAIVVIFIPVAFMKGMIGRFFFQFGMTVVFAVTVSLFVSFTLTPMLASRYLKSHSRTEKSVLRKGMWGALSDRLETAYQYLERAYRWLLEIALAHRAVVVISAIIIFVSSIVLAGFFVGKELLPLEDQSKFQVSIQTPVDYSIEQVDRMGRQVESMLKTFPEVTSILYDLGGGRTMEINKVTLRVNLKPKSQRTRSQEQIKTEVRKALQQMPGLRASVEQLDTFGGGQRQVAIIYNVRGRDLSKLESYAQQISKEFAKTPGTVDVDTSLQPGKPEIKAFIDRDKAADLGLNVTTIAETVNFLIGGELNITKFKDESKGRRYDVRARLRPEDRTNPDDLDNLYVRNSSGGLVQLSNVVTLKEGSGPSMINRLDRQRSVSIFANLENTPLGTAMDRLNKISASVLTDEYSGKYTGMAQLMGETFGYLAFALFLGILLAYMVLAAQFESFIHPFTVLLSMPLALIGAFGALFIFNKTLSLVSYIGLILLMGLVKKNAILLVDYTNVLRSRGLSRKEALLEAGPVRLRPILMTTFAMIFGMLPIAVGIGEGAETRSPMAVSVIGGLLTSLFLTLVVVPVVYDVLAGWTERKKQIVEIVPQTHSLP